MEAIACSVDIEAFGLGGNCVVKTSGVLLALTSGGVDSGGAKRSKLGTFPANLKGSTAVSNAFLSSSS